MRKTDGYPSSGFQIVRHPAAVAALELRDAVHAVLGPSTGTEHPMGLASRPEMTIPELNLGQVATDHILGVGIPPVTMDGVINMGNVINLVSEGGAQ